MQATHEPCLVTAGNSLLELHRDTVREVRGGTTLIVTVPALEVPDLTAEYRVRSPRSWKRREIHIQDNFTGRTAVADLLIVPTNPTTKAEITARPRWEGCEVLRIRVQEVAEDIAWQLARCEGDLVLDGHRTTER